MPYRISLKCQYLDRDQPPPKKVEISIKHTVLIKDNVILLYNNEPLSSCGSKRTLREHRTAAVSDIKPAQENLPDKKISLNNKDPSRPNSAYNS